MASMSDLLQYKAPGYSGPWKFNQFEAIGKAQGPFDTCIDGIFSPSGGPS
jgi:hypothetical protein